MIQIYRNCWSFTINGLIAILYGILALSLPEETLITIAKYTGAVIILAGVIFGLIAYKRYKKNIPVKLIFTESLLMIALGILVLVFTTETISFFISLIGVWIAITGIFELIALVNITALPNKNIFLINAIISLLFGILLIVNPFDSAKVLIVISGILALVFGIVMIWFSLILRNSQKQEELDL